MLSSFLFYLENTEQAPLWQFSAFYSERSSWLCFSSFTYCGICPSYIASYTDRAVLDALGIPLSNYIPALSLLLAGLKWIRMAFFKGAIQGLLLVELFLGNYLGSFGLLLACFTSGGWIVSPCFLVYLWDFLSLLGRVTLLHNQHTHTHTPQKKTNVNSNIKTTNKLLISITLNIYCSLEEDEKDWGSSRRFNWIDKPTMVIRF